MLTGQAPWTAAALYRREFVKDLRWPEHICFAFDWAWAWTVCLAGARFASLDIKSAVYNHHDCGQLTTNSNGFEKSVTARQQILQMVQESLYEKGLLTMDRRRALAQYFYKDALTLCEREPSQLKALCDRCDDLVPGFRPIVYNPRMRPFITAFGPYAGAKLYVRVKTIITNMGALNHAAWWILRKMRCDYPVGG
jgi:hypothetical protein